MYYHRAIGHRVLIMASRSNTIIVVLAGATIAAGTVLIVLPFDSADVLPMPRVLRADHSKKTMDDSSFQASRFEFGNLLIGRDATVERAFTFKNESADRINLESIVGQPSCCVRAIATPHHVPPGGEFELKLVVKIDRKPGLATWRGIAKTRAGRSFVAEATATLVPRLKGELNNDSVAEIERDETLVREGKLKFIGEAKPNQVVASSSDSAVRWTTAPWKAAGHLEGTDLRVWEASIRAETVGRGPGSFSTINRFDVKPSGEHASISLGWNVRSNWRVSPKVVALTPTSPVGRFVLVSLESKGETAPAVATPTRLRVKRSRIPQGWEFEVSIPQPPRSLLEVLKVTADGEELELPVDLAAFNRQEAAQ